ncbi:ferritin-like domain-containing protein [Actinacidiphila sp. bgisy167]|uniref:ferritin-like domain-containing protein n=1 Tax=Actinacidiphila sp. bgisy167 TaxID=3413797 RepID=UPI003D7127F5
MTEQVDDQDSGRGSAVTPPAALDRRGFVRSAALAAVTPAVLGTTAHAAPLAPSSPAAVPATVAAAATAAPAAAPGAAAAAARGMVARLLAVPPPSRGTPWLRQALQVAVELELATIPPYLCAWWSVRDRSATVARLLRGIVTDEMFHMGLACNMLVAVGGRPRIASVTPDYPCHLPGGVRSELTVSLSGLTRPYVRDVLMAIETPESPRPEPSTGPPTIGDFYNGVVAAFLEHRPELSVRGQLGQRIGPDELRPMRTLDDVVAAIEIIKEQGEGSASSPAAPVGEATGANRDLAHYYAFAEIYHGRTLRETDGQWEFSGPPIPFPEVHPMGVVPRGGWPHPPREAAALLRRFDTAYGGLLRDLEAAWSSGDHGALNRAVRTMGHLEEPALALMEIPLGDGRHTYGPQFRPLAPAGAQPPAVPITGPPGRRP